jgi:hypothetical protein
MIRVWGSRATHAGILVAVLFLCAWGARADPIVLEGKVPDVRAEQLGMLVGDTLIFGAHSAAKGRKQLVAADIAARQSIVLADDLGGFRFIAADPRRVAIIVNDGKGRVMAIDRETGRRTERCCYGMAQTGYFVGETLRLIASEGRHLAVTTIDLNAETPPIVTTLPRGVPVAWGDRLVLIDEGRTGSPSGPSTVTLFGPDFKVLATGSIPSQEVRDNVLCKVDSPVIGGTMLAYVSSCGRIVLFDLAAMRTVRTLPYFSEAEFYRIAFSDGLLLAAPRGKGEGVAVFDTSDGRSLATLPVTTLELFATDQRLVTVHTETHPDPNIEVYRINAAQIRSGTGVVNEIILRCEAAAAALRAGGAVEDALSTIESGTVAPLVDQLETLDDRDLAAAEIYARLLARSVDRVSEGLALLVNLRARKPEDRHISAYADAARSRMQLLTGDPVAGEPTLRAALGARDITLGTGSSLSGLTPGLMFAGDRIYVTEYGQMGDTCAILSLFGRRDLALEAIVPVAGCDDEFQDYITDVAVGGMIYAALEYRFEDAGRPDLVAIHPQDPAVSATYHLMGSIQQLAVTKDGLLVCGSETQCELRKEIDLEAEPKLVEAVLCRPQGRSFPAALGPEALLAVAASGGYIAACNDRFMAQQVGEFDKARIQLYRVDALDHSIAEASTGQGTQVALGEGDGPVVVSGTSVNAMVLRSIAPQTGKVRTELRLAFNPNVGASWAVDGQTLFVGRGRDLLVYDMGRGTLSAVLRDFVPEDDRPGHDHRIVQLVIDAAFDHLVVLTQDGHHSQVVSLKALARATQGSRSTWRGTDAVLAAD